MSIRVPRVYDPKAEKGSHGVPEVELYYSSTGEELVDFQGTWEGLRNIFHQIVILHLCSFSATNSFRRWIWN